MIPILYRNTETEFSSNGLGRLYDCIDCFITEERNGVYECEFNYPVKGVNFEQIKVGRIVAATVNDSGEIQPFDIVSETKPINGIVTFFGTHISYRLHKVTASGTNINSLSNALTMLGTGTPSNQFTFEADFTASGYMAAADGTPRTVRSMLGGVEGSILDTYGGEFTFDKWRVALQRERGERRTFPIRYGVNLVDYNEEVNSSETFTGVIPYWSNGEILIKGSVIYSGESSVSGREEVVPLDCSDKFEYAPTIAQLESYAVNYLSANQPYLPKQTIDINFVNLADTLEYEDIAPLLDYKLCDTVPVIFPMYGTNAEFKIVKTVYDVLGERYTSMELGTLSTTLAEALGISGDGPSPTKESVVKNITRDSIGGARDITATTRTLVKTINHTSATGRVRVFVNHGFYTSRFTSSAQLVVNGTQVSSQRTNVNPNPNTSVCDRITHYAIVDVPKNQPSKFEYYLQGQDSGTTATIPAYKDGAFVIEDI